MRLIFTVTTDLTYDQRMQRICQSLTDAGHDVCLIGRELPSSRPLENLRYEQKRLRCWFHRGPLFYLEYNLRLLCWLLRCQADVLIAIDLDTILPVLTTSLLRNKSRVYDAHELFCEMQEIVTRPIIYRIWKTIEWIAVPRFKRGYTVNQPIADAFQQMYGVDYRVVRNIARWEAFWQEPKPERYFIYQGAVNEGRAFETLIPAMKQVSIPLYICGDGNFMTQAKALAKQHGVEDRVIFKGMVPPAELRVLTRQAFAGITLFDPRGKSNYYSLANRFFDYIHAYIPQICVDYPVYREINDQHRIAMLVPNVEEQTLADALNNLAVQAVVYETLRGNCIRAAQVLNWQQEEQVLLEFFQQLEQSLNEENG